MCPGETPETILRNMAQVLRGLLDTQPDLAMLTVPRSWIEALLEDVVVSIATLRHEGR